MAFSIQIQIDPSQAKSGADAVTTALGKTGEAGTKAGDAIVRGLGASAAASANAKAQLAAYEMQLLGIEQAGSGRGLADRFEREAQMLQKIRGPMQDYSGNLSALDSLMSKGTITTNEYADSVRRLEEQLSRTGSSSVAETQLSRPQFGPAPAPWAPQLAQQSGAIGMEDISGGLSHVLASAGPAGAALSGFATSAAGASAAAVAAAVGLVHLGDQYLDLTNKVARFADATHSADSILQENLGAAGAAHGSLSGMVEVYAKVREATDDMNLTQTQSIEISKSLAEASTLSGHGLDGAASAAQRLSFMMESGTAAPRELKSLMRDMPALADAWSASTGKTREELLKMAKDGTLSVSQLVTSLAQPGNAIDQQMTSHITTASEAWDHFKDSADLAIGKITADSGLIGGITSGVEQLTASLSPLVKQLDDLAAAGHGAFGGLMQNVSAFKDMHPDVSGVAFGNLFTNASAVKGMAGDAASDVWNAPVAGFMGNSSPTAAQREGLDQMAKSEQNALDIMKELGTSLTGLGAGNQDPWSGPTASTNSFAHALGDLGDALISANSGMANALAVGTQYANKAQTVVAKLAETVLNGYNAFDPWHGSGFAGQSKQLSETQKILNDINGPMREYGVEMRALNALAHDGKVSVSEYNAELDKIVGRTIGHGAEAQIKADVAAYDAATAAVKRLQEMKDHGILDPAAWGPTGFKGKNNLDDREREGDALGDLRTAKQWDTSDAAGVSDREKLLGQLMNENATSASKYADELLKLKAVRDVSGGEALYATALQNTQDRLNTLKTPMEDYEAAIRKIQAAVIPGVTSIDAVNDALMKNREQFGQATFADNWTTAMDRLQKSVVDAGGAIDKVFTGAIDNVNNSLVDLATTGTTDFHKLATGIERDLAMMTLKMGESALAKGLMPDASRAITSAVTGAQAGGLPTAETSAATATDKLTVSLDAASTATDEFTARMAGGAVAGGIPGFAGLLDGSGSVGGYGVIGGLGASDAIDAASVATVASYHRQPSTSGSLVNTDGARESDKRTAGGPTHVHNHIHLDDGALMDRLEHSPRMAKLITTKVVRTRGALRSRR